MAKELVDLKTEFKKQLKLSKIDINSITDRKLRLSTEGTVNAAKNKLQQLKPQVMQMMMNKSTTIFVSDTIDLSEAIKTLQEKNDNVILLDFLGLEKTILNTAYPSGKIKGYPFNVSAVSRINNALFELRNPLKVDYLPPIAVSAANYKVLSSRQEAQDLIQDLLYKNFSNELKSLYLGKEMNDSLEARMADMDSLVFFVVNTNGSLKGLEGLTGKFVLLDEVEEAPKTAEELQKLVTKKLKKTENKK